MDVLQYIIIFISAILVYIICDWVVVRFRLKILSPVILASAITIALLKFSGTSYDLYYQATLPIKWLLGPSVVALGWVMYSHIDEIKENLKLILLTTLFGSIFSVVIVIVLSRLFALPTLLEHSLVPKSVTTPIAMQVSTMVDGNSAITIAAVVMTGVLGFVISPILYKIFGVKEPIAQGLGLGCAAHAIGTARAMEFGALQGAVSGMAIGVMGLFTAIVAPLIYYILELLLK